MKKKSLMIVLALSLTTLFAVGTTVSYFADEAGLANTITMGDVEIEIAEEIVVNGKDMVGATNTGKNPAWVRLFVGLPKGLGGNDIYETTPFTDGDIKNPDTNGGGWTWSPGADGYYYYSDPVAPGETAYLFSSIKKINEVVEGNLPSNIDIVIYAEAVQATYANTAEEAFSILEGTAGN